MKTVIVPRTPDAPSSLDWKVRVEWMPRWKGWARKFGGWRKKHDPADSVPDLGWGYPDYATGYADRSTGRGATSTGGRGGDGWFDGDFDLGEGIVVLVLVFVAAIAAVALLWWVLIPLALIIIDVLAVIVLLLFGTLARVLLRRPWTVAAVSARGHRITKQVVGWRRALDERDLLAERLRTDPPQVA